MYLEYKQVAQVARKYAVLLRIRATYGIPRHKKEYQRKYICGHKKRLSPAFPWSIVATTYPHTVATTWPQRTHKTLAFVATTWYCVPTINL